MSLNFFWAVRLVFPKWPFGEIFFCINWPFLLLCVLKVTLWKNPYGNVFKSLLFKGKKVRNKARIQDVFLTMSEFIFNISEYIFDLWSFWPFLIHNLPVLSHFQGIFWHFLTIFDCWFLSKSHTWENPYVNVFKWPLLKGKKLEEIELNWAPEKCSQMLRKSEEIDYGSSPP